MIWINFLHLYQPGNTEDRFIKDAVEKSYKRIVSALEKNPHIKFTLNISGCLLLRMDGLGYGDLIQRIKTLVEKGQVELTGSASYHPILPLIPKDQAISQIKENEQILLKYFNYKPRGFFSPEMAYSPKLSKLIKSLGYEWLILDELSAAEPIDKASAYEDKASGLKIIFRSRSISQTFVPETIADLANKNSNETIITATDGELYGLRHIDPQGKLESLLKLTSYGTKTISEFLAGVPTKPIDLRESTWESSEDELKNELPFALWRDKNNEIHKNLWKLTALACKTIKKFQDDTNYAWARWHLVRGMASCMFWWASGKDFRHVFGPICWGPDEIERGANDLIRSIRALESESAKPMKLKAEKLHAKIRHAIWKRHWTN